MAALQNLVSIIVGLALVPAHAKYVKSYSTPKAGEMPAFLPCKLEWKAHDYGDPFPGDLVAIHPGKNFVGRVAVGSSWVGATVDQDGFAFSIIGRRESYELLLNPNRCKISWIKSGSDGWGDVPNSDYLVEIGGQYVARMMHGSEWKAGTGFRNHISWFLGIPLFRTHSSYQVLVSQSPGLHLKIDALEFTSDPFEDKDLDFMGMDEIYNKSPVEISQTVTHSKSFTESTTITETNGYSNTQSVSATAGFSAFGASASVTAEASWTQESSTSKAVTKETTVEVSTSRQITVPPLNSIHACSTLTMAEDFVMGWEAKGRFSLENMSADEIKKVLKDLKSPYADAIDESEQSETEVLVSLTGQFRGSLALSSKFIVVPSNSITGCVELSNAIAAVKRAKRDRKSRAEVLSLKLKVNEVLEAIIGLGGVVEERIHQEPTEHLVNRTAKVITNRA